MAVKPSNAALTALRNNRREKQNELVGAYTAMGGSDTALLAKPTIPKLESAINNLYQSAQSGGRDTYGDLQAMSGAYNDYANSRTSDKLKHVKSESYAQLVSQPTIMGMSNPMYGNLTQDMKDAGLTLEDIDYTIDETEIASILSWNRDEVEQKALSSNQLSIKMLTQLQEVNRIAEKIAKGYVNWKPDIALQASAGYSGSRFPFVELNWRRKDDYSLNLSLGIKTTVWDGGKKLNDVSRKISETKTADINQLDARSTIKQTLNVQWNTADVCTMKIEYQDLKIESVDSKIKQQETIFASGYGSETDVLNAKIDRCNQLIEKERQSLTRAVACLTIKALTK